MKKEYILALITVTLWGTLASCSKLMMGSLTPMAVLFYSSAIASVTLLVVNLCINGPSGFRQYRLQDYGIIAGLGFIGLFLYTALYYTGLNYLTSQIGCIINYMWPMMIILFSCIILRGALPGERHWLYCVPLAVLRSYPCKTGLTRCCTGVLPVSSAVLAPLSATVFILS